MSTSSTYYINAAHFNHMVYQGSAVIGDYLYLDGGEVIVNTGTNATVFPYGIDWHVLNDTLSIPLQKSWTNSTVSFTAISRLYPQQRVLNYENLWLSKDNTSFYMFGGEVSGVDGAGGVPTQPRLWQFAPDGSGGGGWSEASQAEDDIFLSLSQPSNALSTSGNGAGYALGGLISCTTYANPAVPCGSQSPLSGLVTLNMSSNSWSNITASGNNGYNTYGTAFHGGAQFVPMFGSEGVALFFGGQESSDGSIANSASPDRPLNSIGIFDPSSQKWYAQTATGEDVPTYREQFCYVGVEGDNGTYEIFLYGGMLAKWDVESTTNETANNLDQVYVLSLPSFTWYKANYTAQYNRFGHTCQVVGKRQMLSFGGYNWYIQHPTANRNDPFTLGLGIFDMTQMQWSDSYNASAAEYQTPDVIKSYTSTNGEAPDSWDNEDLAQIFKVTQKSSSSNSTHTPTNSAAPKPSSNLILSSGAIAGIAIGAAAGITLVGLSAWLLIRRHRRKEQQQQNDPKHLAYPPQEYHHPLEKDAAPRVHEVDGWSYRNELPSHQLEPWEIDGQGVRGSELAGDTHYTRK